MSRKHLPRDKRSAPVGPRTPAVKWLRVPIALGVRGRILGVTDDTANADAVFAELERQAQRSRIDTR
jgi:hypothetical protein